MELKIITQEQAEREGLTGRNTQQSGGSVNQYLYGVIGKIGLDSKGKRDKSKDQVMEFFRIDKHTHKKEILEEKPEWKEHKKKEKINEYKD